MRKIIFVLIGFLLFLAVYLKINREAYVAAVDPRNQEQVTFQIKKGEGSTEVGENLARQGLIRNKYYFWYYVWKTKTDDKLQAGAYKLSKAMTIPAMVRKFTAGEIEEKINKLVVPEGETIEGIVDLLKKQKPEIASEFDRLTNCRCSGAEKCLCGKLNEKYDFLRERPKGTTLEGYLFPDTYFLADKETALSLLNKFLDNFQRKVNEEVRSSIREKGLNLHQVLTMASIVEKEAKSDEDRRLIAGIFWKRFKQKHPLQSDATLSYILKTNKVKYSNKETNIDSPYNTYKYVGLPPAPICNPGLEAILATINPQQSDYFYFLNDAQTGETVFSKNFAEHKRNKLKHGL